MLSASAAVLLSVGRFAISPLLPAIGGLSYAFLGVTSQSNHFFLLIGSLHPPLRLAFLPLFNQPPLTYPVPRRSFCHSSAHPLCHSVCLHLLRHHDLRHLYASRGVILGNSSPARLVSFLSPRHRQGLISHRTSLRRAPLRKGHRRIRVAKLDQRTRFAGILEQLDRMAQLHRRSIHRGSAVSLSFTLSAPPDSAPFFPIRPHLRNPTILWHSAHPPFL